MATQHVTDSVTIGSWVRVCELGSGDEDVFHIVEIREVDLVNNKIPPENPLSVALLGSKLGEEIAIEGPNGLVRFAVLEVGRRQVE